MQVICLEESAFYKLLDEVVFRLEEKFSATKDKWIGDEEAMRLLNITSKTTLQKFRDEGKIRFSQPQKKIILYDRDSINEFIESNTRNRF